jgi:carbon-monoxide dehydrogenase large subunit
MYVGTSVARIEDRKFLTGLGRYVDDIPMAGAHHAVFVRSPHANAAIGAIETTAAAAMPGVVAVLTGADWRAGGGGELPCIMAVPFSDGRPMASAPRQVFAVGHARHVGDPVAMIVAETRNQALDALEAIEVDYDPLAAVTDVARAAADGALQIHHNVPGNLCYDTKLGDAAAVDQAFAAARHVTRLATVNNRVFHLPIEPRAMIARYDQADDSYTLYTTTQAPHLIRDFLAEDALGIDPARVRVISPDVGGGFGQKCVLYPEEAAVTWAARLTGAPVRWTSTRSESFLADVHGRDQVVTVDIAFGEAGRIVALRADVIDSLGAYVSMFGPPVAPIYGTPNISELYDIPAIYARIRGVYTNTTPVDAYRGAGQPETAFAVERAMDQAAVELAIDALELRSRNLIQPDAFPFETATGAVYDSGDYPALLAKLRSMADYDGLKAEQARPRDDGRLMGIGAAAFIESAVGGPKRQSGPRAARIGRWDCASIRVHLSGSITVYCGSHSHGQGHATTFRQIAADNMGCALDDIEFVFGDTDRVHAGVGTFASRSLTLVGNAIRQASTKIIDKSRLIAAHMLECDPGDLSFTSGDFVIEGTDRRVAFRDVARAAYLGGIYPEDLEPGLEETAYYDPTGANNSSGLVLAVVLIDPETGNVELRDMFAVDDCGRVINPMIVQGQIHGALAQGIGQALMEHSVYDPESGQPVAGSLMDYAAPRADDLPSFQDARLETPAPGNPLGVKGVGESGTIGAPPAVVNAIINALAPFGVGHVDMPLTPSTVWQAIQTGKAGTA